MTDYPCTSCGCCCKKINLLMLNKEVGNPGSDLYFPYNHNNGTCEKLTTDNKCSVYENRPLICNIAKMADYLKSDKKQFFKENIIACNKMMDADNIPLQFRIIS